MPADDIINRLSDEKASLNETLLKTKSPSENILNRRNHL
jgi:hypothetical protein